MAGRANNRRKKMHATSSQNKKVASGAPKAEGVLEKRDESPRSVEAVPVSPSPPSNENVVSNPANHSATVDHDEQPCGKDASEKVAPTIVPSNTKERDTVHEVAEEKKEDSTVSISICDNNKAFTNAQKDIHTENPTTTSDCDERASSNGDVEKVAPKKLSFAQQQDNKAYEEDEEKKQVSSTTASKKEVSVIQPTVQLPLVASFSDGLRRKHRISDLAAWAQLALTLDGRDKITKVLQYSSRFLAWWFLGTKQATRFETLKKSLSNSRKAFRLGRTLIELQRFQKMGLRETIAWHLHQSDNTDTSSLAKSNPKTFIHRVSTNIGLDYSPNEEALQSILEQRILDEKKRPSLFRRCLRHLSSRTLDLSAGAETASKKPLSHILLSATKLLGLACYFGADNVSYLASTGLLDNFKLQDSARLAQRKRVVKFVSENGNRAYFIAALTGLIVSWRNYREFSRTTNEKLKEKRDESYPAELTKAKEKHFSLLLSLLKSCCDVLVFTNNPGVDLWRKVAGKPMNEAVHCSAGLISASTVLCTNFPSHSLK